MSVRHEKCVSNCTRTLLGAALAFHAPLNAAPLPSERSSIHATAAELLNLAGELARRGATDRAESILSALAHDPDRDIRNEARFRHAKLLEGQGKTEQAAELLRQILDESPTATPVRLELARLLQILGDRDAALRELRAAQAAGLPPAVARMVDRYSEALRASRPIGASFEIALAPDSNINSATRSDTLDTVFGDFDIDGGSKATSGVGLSVRGQAYRRFGLFAGEQSLLVRLSGYGDLYHKSRFNDVAADVAAGPELRAGRNRINLEIGATQRWFGQKAFLRSARLVATWTRSLGSRMQLRAGGSAALVDNQRNDLQDGKAYSVQLGLERSLSPTTGVAVNLSLDRQSLRDPGYSTTGWRAGLVGWKDVGRATVTASAEFGRLKADERLLLFPDKRSDHYSRLTIGATLRQLTFGGFAPVVQFTIERNRSNIEFYDYKRTRSEFVIVRAF